MQCPAVVQHKAGPKHGEPQPPSFMSCVAIFSKSCTQASATRVSEVRRLPSSNTLNWFRLALLFSAFLPARGLAPRARRQLAARRLHRRGNSSLGRASVVGVQSLQHRRHDPASAPSRASRVRPRPLLQSPPTSSRLLGLSLWLLNASSAQSVQGGAGPVGLQLLQARHSA